jgi:4-amino-4-deoxy-L-arabinose transferase-like glycosyltransferase
MCTLILAVGLPSIIYPFGFDQANQAYIASRVLGGDVLFKDVVSLKPVLTIWFHVVSLWLFGHNMMSIRIADLIWVMIVSLLIFRFAIRAFPERGTWVGLIGGLFYAVFYYSHTFWHTAQADGWMNVPVAMAFLLVLDLVESDRPAGLKQFFYWVAVGSLGACAVLFKYTALGIVAALVAFSLMAFKKNRKSGLTCLGGFCVGFALIGLFFFVWLWAHGAIRPFFQSHFADVISYASGKVTGSEGGGGRWGDLIRKVIPRLFNSIPLGYWFLAAPRIFLIGLVGLVGMILRIWPARKNIRQVTTCLIILMWFGSAWTSTALQGRWFPYHFLPLLPPLALLGSWLIVSGAYLAKKILRSWTFAVLSISALVIAVAIAEPRRTAIGFISIKEQYSLLIRALPHHEGILSLWKSGAFDVADNYSVSETTQVAEYLRDHTSPQDTLFIWGTNLGIDFLARRPRVSGIDTSFQAVGQVSGKTGGPERLMADLKANSPDVFLLQKGDQVPHILGHFKDSYRLLMETPPVLEFVSRNYEEKTTIGHFIVLFRR